MIKLFPNETVILVIRRHWIVFVLPGLTFTFLLIAPVILLAAAPSYLPGTANATVGSLVKFFYAIYLMAVLLGMLIFWVKYYLDAWILTDQRIITIDQHGLFDRRISEIAMERVQDVTIEIPSLLATFLGYGTIRVQTASESAFSTNQVPDCYRAKDLILKYSRSPREAIPHDADQKILRG